MADAMERRAGALTALGEKARTVEQVLADGEATEVCVSDVVASAVSDSHERSPDTSIEFAMSDNEDTSDDGSDQTVGLRSDALRAVVENVVENAIEHHDCDGVERDNGEPWVRVSLRRERSVDKSRKGRESDEDGNDRAGDNNDHGGGERYVLSVADDGPGIPDHEITAVESGRETALEHGSGLGLWVVTWAADALGGDVDYADRDPRGTVVTVTIPVDKTGL